MKPTYAKALPLFLTTLSIFACTSGTTASTNGSLPANDAGQRDTDAADSDAAPDDAASDAGGCGVILNTGSLVHPTGDGRNPLPRATGGIIADGTYVVTAETQYEHDAAGNNSYIICGAQLDDFSEAFRFASGRLEIAGQAGGASFAGGGTFDTSGTILKQHFSCPTSEEAVFGYTATGTKLLLIGGPGGKDSNGTCGPIVLELTRQP